MPLSMPASVFEGRRVTYQILIYLVATVTRMNTAENVCVRLQELAARHLGESV